MAELDWLALLFHQSVNQRFDSGSFPRWPRGWWKHWVTRRWSARSDHTHTNSWCVYVTLQIIRVLLPCWNVQRNSKKIKKSPDCSSVHLKNLEMDTIEFRPRLPHWELHWPRTSLILIFFIYKMCISIYFSWIFKEKPVKAVTPTRDQREFNNPSERPWLFNHTLVTPAMYIET